jgi:hypothetical protein
LDNLESSDLGIIVLTKENIRNPWILFEAGGLTKGLSKKSVCTFLVDLEYSDLTPPLSMFQGTLPNKGDIKNLLRTINKHLDGKRLDDIKFNRTFDHWWDDFIIGFTKLIDEYNNNTKEKLFQNPDVTNSLLHKLRELENDKEEQLTALRNDSNIHETDKSDKENKKQNKSTTKKKSSKKKAQIKSDVILLNQGSLFD